MTDTVLVAAKTISPELIALLPSAGAKVVTACVTVNDCGTEVIGPEPPEAACDAVIVAVPRPT